MAHGTRSRKRSRGIGHVSDVPRGWVHPPEWTTWQPPADLIPRPRGQVREDAERPRART